MKQITPKIKQRIFGLYYGQNIIGSKGFPSFDKYEDLTTLIPMVVDGMYLWVKPLSSISDEDAIQLLFPIKLNDFGHIKTWRYDNCIVIDYRWVDDEIKLEDGFAYSGVGLSFNSRTFTPYQIDKARELGYAVDYLDFTVEELVLQGVFKLTE